MKSIKMVKDVTLETVEHMVMVGGVVAVYGLFVTAWNVLVA